MASDQCLLTVMLLFRVIVGLRVIVPHFVGLAVDIYDGHKDLVSFIRVVCIVHIYLLVQTLACVQ